MAAPNYRYGDRRYSGGREFEAPGRPERERQARRMRDLRRRESRERVQAARRRRSFILLVVIPAALLLGSVYLHNLASNTQQSIDALQERIDSAEARYERLGVREAELSSPERIRTLAEENHGLQGTDASQVEVIERQAGSGDGIGAQGDQVEVEE